MQKMRVVLVRALLFNYRESRERGDRYAD